MLTIISRHCFRSHVLEMGLNTITPRLFTSLSAWKRWKSSKASFAMDTPSTRASGKKVVMGLQEITTAVRCEFHKGNIKG